MISRYLGLLALVLVVATSTSAPRAQSQERPRPNEPTGDILVCGEDKNVPPIPLRWSTVVLAGDGRLFIPCPDQPKPPTPHPTEHRELRERFVLSMALGSREVEIRWRALQARARLTGSPHFQNAIGFVGIIIEKGLDDVDRVMVRPACNAEIRLRGGNTMRGGDRWNPGLLFQHLRDPLPRIREEAAIGLQVALGEEEYSAEVAKFARDEIDYCVKLQNSERSVTEVRTTVTALLIEALGIVKYGDDVDRAVAEKMLLTYARGRSHELLAAVRGLEALIRLAPRRPIAEETRVRLRELTRYGSRLVDPPPNPFDARIRRLAFMALQAARDDDTATLAQAIDDADWQVRRLIVQRLNLANPEHASIAERLNDEPVFQVRYDLLTPLSRDAARLQQCAPLVKYVNDPEPLVALRAMDVLIPACAEDAEFMDKLIKLTDLLRETSVQKDWHKPSRALTALGRLKPEEATKRLPAAVKHDVWQVRAAAAGVAVSLNSPEHLETLSRDPIANVRNAAIDAMVRAKHPGLWAAAIDALKTSVDYQLLRTAAASLARAPAEVRPEATEALLAALRTLTEGGEDTSRDPRVAILERLGEFVEAARSSDIQPWVGDYDPAVVAAAVKAFEATGAGTPATFERKRRYPYQPTEEALGRLPTQMILQLDGGTVAIDLLPEVAPVTIARITALAGQGYYNGLTFHRIVPNFVVQGGSPGASEYVGTSRFLRDELGAAPHIRGAVGISTRGRDTGDAQLFIDLVDLPRLDRNYTVIGYVRAGMEHVDRLLEGAVIKSVTIK